MAEAPTVSTNKSFSAHNLLHDARISCLTIDSRLIRKPCIHGINRERLRQRSQAAGGDRQFVVSRAPLGNSAGITLIKRQAATKYAAALFCCKLKISNKWKRGPYDYSDFTPRAPRDGKQPRHQFSPSARRTPSQPCDTTSSLSGTKETTRGNKGAH